MRNISRRTRSRYRISLCFCFLLTVLVSVSAKIRIPSSFLSAESESQQDADTATAKGPAKDSSEATATAAHEKENDFDRILNSWLLQNWSDGAAAEKAAQQEQSQSQNPRWESTGGGSGSGSGKRYGIPFTYLTSLVSSTTQEYLSRLEENLKNFHESLYRAQRFLASGLWIVWKTTNDVARYKFPVGIVSAWSAVRVAKKFLKIQERNKHKKRKNSAFSEGGDENLEEEPPDNYKYSLWHNGRAFDLDDDDLTSYRHLGGIEQVRSRLLRSAFSEGGKRKNQNRNEGEGEDETVNENEREKEKLLDALLAALSLEFIPGGSHSEYIRRMIPSFAKAEECAHKLRLQSLVAALAEGGPSESGKRANHNHRRHHRRSDDGEVDTNESPAMGDNEARLLALALQTAEVRILDSKLRSIRDRLIRTTYRLDRTVKYWKSKVESARLSSSLMASATTTTSWKLLPLSRLKRRWSRLFFYGSGNRNAASFTNNPNFANNSLLEGDRLRLAFAEAAYKAEIVRLGKVLHLLCRRPEEMPDSTLTNALVDQQQERRKREEEIQLEQTMRDGDDGDDDSTECDDDDMEARVADEALTQNKIAAPWDRMRSMAIATKDRIAKNLDREHKINSPPPVEKQNLFSTMVLLLEPCRSTGQKIAAFSARWRQQRTKKKKHPKGKSFFSIRFNADGRGKFSVQTYDEGSVAIESDTAKRLMLRNYDDYQKPWMEETNIWSLEARGLIVDTVRETVEASIHPLTNGRLGGTPSGISGSTYRYYTNRNKGAAATTELDDLEFTWRVRNYADPDGETSDDDTYDALAERQPKLFPALLSPKKALPPLSSSTHYRQWMFVYEMSRDINRLKRVGEGKSLKFKWKEVHWIHWLMQWNLMGLPSAALKIWAATWIHDWSKPHVPRIQEISRETYVAILEILTTRFWTPFKNLVGELTSRKTKLVTGVSLEEEEASLDIMLRDLGLGDGTPATRHEATIKATRQYESDMRAGLMWHAIGGRLVRLMLIQVQQLKVSMLDAAETMDVLFQANKINMQLMAVIPAIGILFVGTKVFVRFLYSVRAKDLRPIASVHAEMTDYLNELESNIILMSDDNDDGREDSATATTDESSSNNGTPLSALSSSVSGEKEKQQQLGEFALTLYNYLLLLDFSSPQPFSSRQCDVIHRSLTTFLGRNGSFRHDGITVDGRSRLLDIVKGKHKDLFL